MKNLDNVLYEYKEWWIINKNTGDSTIKDLARDANKTIKDIFGGPSVDVKNFELRGEIPNSMWGDEFKVGAEKVLKLEDINLELVTQWMQIPILILINLLQRCI